MIKYLITLILKETDKKLLKHVIIIAIVSGISNAALLAILNIGADSASNEGLNYRLLIMYALIFTLFFITKKFVLLRTSNEIEGVITNLRDRISDKLIKTELTFVESFDKSNLFNRLTQDIGIISNSIILFASSIQAIVMVFFSIIYILIISPVSFMVVIAAFVIVTFMYLAHAKDSEKDLIETSIQEGRFFNSIDAILSGFKEIKVNSTVSRDFFKEHKGILKSLLDLKQKTNKIFITGMMYSEVFLYILLGAITFLVPHFVPSQSGLIIKVITATLFIIGPFGMVVGLFPTLSKTGDAIKNIYELEDMISKNVNDDLDEEIKIKNFKEINLNELTFHYKDKTGDKVFSIGPINLTINRGEVIFIIGGNGSGKSTFVKTLLGLYHPSDGHISLGKRVIDKYNYQAYRDLFGIILTDFYLFQRLFGIDKEIDYDKVYELLIEMQLERKTKLIDGKFTNVDLSTGQRKRLALISLMLNDKPIYVFDEWAADQDPEFRKYFYYEIIKNLKNEGKTVIAVTHDDAYFDIADRVFKMDYGQLKPYKEKSI